MISTQRNTLLVNFLLNAVNLKSKKLVASIKYFAVTKKFFILFFVSEMGADVFKVLAVVVVGDVLIRTFELVALPEQPTTKIARNDWIRSLWMEHFQMGLLNIFTSNPFVLTWWQWIGQRQGRQTTKWRRPDRNRELALHRKVDFRHQKNWNQQDETFLLRTKHNWGIISAT